MSIRWFAHTVVLAVPPETEHRVVVQKVTDQWFLPPIEERTEYRGSGTNWVEVVTGKKAPAWLEVMLIDEVKAAEWKRDNL